MVYNEMDRIGINELNSALQKLIKQNLFSSFKVSNNTVSATSINDTLEFIQGNNISIVPDLKNRTFTISITGSVAEAVLADSANSVDWSGVQNKPVDWVVNQGVNYTVYNSGKIEQWGYITTNKNNWVNVAFPISFNNVTNISLVLNPVCRLSTYTGTSPANSPNVKGVSLTGFSCLLTNSGTTWDLFYFAVAK